MALTARVTVANPTGATSLTDGDITFPITNGAYRTGTTLDGLPYVVAPNGVKVNAPTPVAETVESRFRNGAQLNPTLGTHANQALDNGGGASTTYSAGLAFDPTTVLRPGDALIKVKSTDTLVSSGRRGMFDQSTALMVVAAAPAANQMAPWIWPAADKANRPWRTVDLDGFLALLPSLSAAGQDVITWDQIAPFHDKFSLDRCLNFSTAGGGYEYMTTVGLSDDAESNYDRYPTRVVSAVLMGLMSSAWSTADKTAAAIRLLQRGCNVVEGYAAFDLSVSNDGGHSVSQYPGAMAWLRATGQLDRYADIAQRAGGNAIRSYYFITQDMIDNDFVYHTDASKPYFSRAREVLSVTNGGLTVSVQGYIPTSGLSGDTKSNGRLRGLNLRRNSDNAQAYITASSEVGSNPGSWTLTLATPISGLTAGEMVNATPPWTVVAGDPDFAVRAPTDFPNVRNPSAFAEYRGLQKTMISHLFCHAIGMSGAAAAPSVAYSLRAMQADTPTAQDDYPSTVDSVSSAVTGSTNNWQTQFYNAHGAALLALDQDV
jgi:hypothetical protein